MTLVLVSALPILALISFASRPLSLRIYTLLDAALLRSGSLCEQALGGMRTLASFCGEEGEAAKVWAVQPPKNPARKIIQTVFPYPSACSTIISRSSPVPPQTHA
jgi:hypothetical protein